MLKTDFNGYAEFAEKILKAESDQEKKNSTLKEYGCG